MGRVLGEQSKIYNMGKVTVLLLEGLFPYV